MANNGQLTADEVGRMRQMLQAWPAHQRQLKTGTATKASRDGHPHRDVIVGDQGEGAPTHHARRGALYLGDNDVQYINTSAQPGGTTWSLVGGGGVAGAHTLDNPVIHTDVDAQANQAGDLLVRDSGNKWDRVGVAAPTFPSSPFRSYLVSGLIPSWTDTIQPQFFKFPPAVAETLSSNTLGSISLAGGSHIRVDTLSSATSGELATVTSVPPNSFYLLRPVSGTRSIVIKHNQGNIWCIGNADITLDDLHDFVIAFAPSTNILWVMGGGVGTATTTTKYHFSYGFGGDNVTGADFPPA